MPIFVYSALRRTGEKTTGEIDALSRADAYQKLDRERLQPISLQLKGGDPVADRPANRTVSSGPLRLSKSQIILFTEELSDLLEAGLQLEPALRIMEQRQELSGLKDVTAALRQQVREGIGFSSALRSVSRSFGELYCNLVTAGELSGALPQILRRQAQFLITIDELQSRVIQALIYPAFICLAGIGMLFVFMTVLVPQLTVLFTQTGKGLPFMTRMLIAVSKFMGTYWMVIIGVIALGSFIFWQTIQKPNGRQWWDKAKLKLPLIGPILTARFYTQFAQTLSTLVINGIPLLNGLRLMQAALPNVYLQSLLKEVIDIVGEGGVLSRALKRVGQFPPIFIDMITVGEQTGDMGAALEKVAKRYDKELNQRIQRMTALIQPSIIVVMAILVGVVAYSMVTGIFQSMSGLRVHHH